MVNKVIKYSPVGIVHSPFHKVKGTPIQPHAATGTEGTIEVFPQYVDGLRDLDGFSHIILIYHFHLAKHTSMRSRPFLDKQERGIFAIRSPNRPNPIGISVLRLDRMEDNILHVRDVDILDGTPVLDIKPYVPEFDCMEADRVGWLSGNLHKLAITRDDGRFVK